MTEVAIEYCVPCGHLDRASDLHHDLLDELGQEVERVSLVTGDGGVFEVSVDGDVVYDKSEAGGAPDVDELVAEVRDRS